jgi:RHS repeat-associated protein
VLRENNPHNLAQLIRLPGQQFDEETGLYYNRHRYYDPKQGRYITQDPIGLRGMEFISISFKSCYKHRPIRLTGD